MSEQEQKAGEVVERPEHERIWLEPAGASDRCWCQDNQWGDEGVEYVLASTITSLQERIKVLEGALARQPEGQWSEFTENHRRHFPHPNGTEVEVSGFDTQYRQSFSRVMRVRSPEWNGYAPYIAWWRLPLSQQESGNTAAVGGDGQGGGS